MTDTTNLDELIKAEREKANKRIAKLRKHAADEQKRVDGKVVELLQAQKPDLYACLADEARAALEAEKAERSRKAKAAVSSTEEPSAGAAVIEEPATGEPVVEQSHEEARQSWNG